MSYEDGARNARGASGSKGSATTWWWRCNAARGLSVHPVHLPPAYMNREIHMRAIAAFALLATLAACASAPPAPIAGPLRAELTEDEFGTRVHLSAPAYVALFSVTPGAGAYLVYPRDVADRPMLAAGNHLVVSRTSTRGRQTLSGGGNTFLYVIASKEPLEVEQFQTGDRSVEDVIGQVNATSHDLEVVMSSLDVAVMSTDATVAGPWTSDVLTPWERLSVRGRLGTPGAGVVRSSVDCPGGGVSIVNGCNGHRGGIAPTPAERRANRPNAGGGNTGGTGGGTQGGGGGAKPGGTGNN